jgi:hypothetical protein
MSQRIHKRINGLRSLYCARASGVLARARGRWALISEAASAPESDEEE